MSLLGLPFFPPPLSPLLPLPLPLPFPFPFTKDPSHCVIASTSIGAGPWCDDAAADPGLWILDFDPNVVSIKTSISCLMSELFVRRDLFRIKCFSKSWGTNNSIAVHLMSSESTSLAPDSFFRASYRRIKSSSCSIAGLTPSQDFVLSGLRIALKMFLFLPAVTGSQRRFKRRQAS